MRVYELAKELELSSKDLISALKENGVAVSSHMSMLSEADVVKARQAARSATKSSKAMPAPAASEVKQSSTPVSVQKQERASRAPSKTVVAEKPASTSQSTPSVSSSPSTQHVKKVDMTDSVKTVRPNEASVKTPIAKQPHYTKELRPVRHHEVAKAALDSDDVPEELVKTPGTIIDEVILEKLGSAPLPVNARGQEKFARIFAEKKRTSRRRRRSFHRPQQQDIAAPKVITELEIAGPMRVGDLATGLNKPVGDLILSLLKRGMVCTINHVLQPDMVKTMSEHYGIKATIAAKNVVVSEENTSSSATMKVKKAATEGLTRRPIVVVMGHVDHGKTTLLDYVRRKNVAASEKGGITQHLGAYEVSSKQGKVIFLDTPGHEAFSYIRRQGSKITDIAILVVAADDGIKPQTIEAIKHAKEAEVPIIVAINKIDKIKSPTAIETIKRQLAQHDLMTEDWGGQVICVPISAKTGEGVDELLDMVILQSQMMDLKARTDVPAKVFVLESHVEKGFGPVATGIVVEGILKQGDFFVCGQAAGKVRLLVDSYDKRLTQATPSVPVKIVGFNSLTDIGEWLTQISAQEFSKYKNNVAELESQKNPATQTKEVLQQFNNVDLQGMMKQKSLNLIIKTDTRGSKEALAGLIEKLARENKDINCPIRVIMSGIGDISEGDVELALNTSSYLLGLHVRAEKNAQHLAKDKGVSLHLHDIIYRLVEFLQEELNKRREIKTSWEKVAEMVVRKVFDIKGLGVIAGCYVRDGVVAKGNKVLCLRDGKQVGESKINSLQRDKKTVKEVHAGYECGFISDLFTEWQEDDEVHVMREVKADKQ
jgi:translation initiation factor IF-2